MASLELEKVTEVPNSLKKLVRMVVNTFESVEESLIVDLLLRYSCMSERHLMVLLKFDPKVIRAKLTNLKMRKFVTMRTRMENAADGTSIKVNYYNIHYVNFLNVMRYKFMMMRKKLENMGKPTQDYPYLWCTNENCEKIFMLWEIGECFDSETLRFYCTFCKSLAEENMTTLPKKDTQMKVAKFNEDLKPLMDLMKEHEYTALESSLVNPLPHNRAIQIAQIEKPEEAKSFAAGPSGSKTEGLDLLKKKTKRNEDVNIVIEMDTDTQQKLPQLRKEMPPWLL